MTMQKSTTKNTAKKGLRCPSCGSKRTTEYDRRIVCTNCSSIIDPKSIKNKKLSPKPKKYLQQTILQTDNLKHLASIDFGEGAPKKWQTLLRVSDATEKRLATTLFEITKIGQSISIPESTLKLALEIYKKIINLNLTRRKPTPVLAATIIYIACRQAGIATSLNQIGHISKIDPDEIRHVYNSFFKKMKPMSNPTTSELYVSKLARSLFQQEKTIEIAEKIICALKDQGFARGKNPVGLGCSACYIASLISGESKTQREIAELGRITEVTIRTRYQEMSKHLLFKISL